jgi:hypothetical protein
LLLFPTDINYISDMEKVKYPKSLVIVSIVVSLGALGWGIYELTNNEFLTGLGFIFGGVIIDSCYLKKLK